MLLQLIKIINDKKAKAVFVFMLAILIAGNFG